MARLHHILAATAILGAVAVVPYHTASAAHPATFPGRNGLIAFQADTGSGYQIYTIDPNGHNLTQITHVSGDAVHLNWSPDGRQIAFELDHPDGPCAIMLMNADGSNQTDLTAPANPPGWTGCEAAPAFTPDGARLVFERYDPTSNVDAIWSMTLSGGDRQEITVGTNNGVTDPQVSPDGQTVSFNDFDGTPYGSALFTAHLDGSALTQITPFSFDVAVKHSWAPDGQHLVLSIDGDNLQPGISANVVTIRPDGSDLRSLTHYTGGQANAFVGSYSPDGQWIVFRLEQNGQYVLYRMNAKNGALHAIIPLGSFRPRFIDWGPAPEH
jgi:Tol biopolymer transport system component